VDANMGLGDYEEAEKDAQWILDLRRGSTLGFVKAAALREAFGDAEGAIEFYNEALLRMPAGEKSARSELMTRNARLQMAAGNQFGYRKSEWNSRRVPATHTIWP
jgi:hypothetical protein